jgi:hypothetical protein
LTNASETWMFQDATAQSRMVCAANPSALRDRHAMLRDVAKRSAASRE